LEEAGLFGNVKRYWILRLREKIDAEFLRS